MAEGCFELHWQRREWGLITLQLFQRCANGQLAMVDKYDSSPFDGPSDLAMWLTRALAHGDPLPLR